MKNYKIVVGLKGHQRSIYDGPISQNTFYEVYKLCSKFHTFIKKCTIVLLCRPTKGKHLHAAGSTENAKKNMPWQGGQKFSGKNYLKNFILGQNIF